MYSNSASHCLIFMKDNYNSACLINMTNCFSYVTFYCFNVSFGCCEFRLLLYIAYIVVNGLRCHMTTLNFGVIIIIAVICQNKFLSRATAIVVIGPRQIGSAVGLHVCRRAT